MKGSEQNQNAQGILQMTLAMTISGTIGWFVLQSGLPALHVVFWRCVFGALALFIMCWWRGIFRTKITPRVIGISIVGGVAIVLNWLLLFSAYPRASISIATVVYNMQPFILLGLGAVFFGEQITKAKLGWLGLAFVGMVMIVQAENNGLYTGNSYVIGIFMALGAAFFWAVAAIAAKKAAGTPPQFIALIQVCVGIVMLIPFVNVSTVPATARTWVLLATTGIVHTGIVYVLMYGAVQKLPTHLQGTLSFIYPVVSVIVDVVALGHALAVLQVVGAIIILLAALGMTQGCAIYKAFAK